MPGPEEFPDQTIRGGNVTIQGDNVTLSVAQGFSLTVKLGEREWLLLDASGTRFMVDGNEMFRCSGNGISFFGGAPAVHQRIWDQGLDLSWAQDPDNLAQAPVQLTVMWFNILSAMFAEHVAMKKALQNYNLVF